MSATERPHPRRRAVALLAGGVGGAKLAHGLQATVGADLSVIVNTGDDLERHGLVVWPDHDTVLYTLAGLEDRDRGWGLRDETWNATGQLAAYGESTWFRLGDRDLATHIVRTERLRAGARPTEIARGLAAALGVQATILPMTDAPVRTAVRTRAGWLDFQEYFVHRAQRPAVLEVRFDGAADAGPTPEVLAALEGATTVVIAPSNPIVSIGPILALPPLVDALTAGRSRGTPIVAVSPIVGGRALKGPADRMLVSLGEEASALGVARRYAGLVDGLVIDAVDAALAPGIEALGMAVRVTDTIMTDDASRARLAVETLTFAQALRERRGERGRGRG